MTCFNGTWITDREEGGVFNTPQNDGLDVLVFILQASLGCDSRMT